MELTARIARVTGQFIQEPGADTGSVLFRIYFFYTVDGIISAPVKTMYLFAP